MKTGTKIYAKASENVVPKQTQFVKGWEYPNLEPPLLPVLPLSPKQGGHRGGQRMRVPNSNSPKILIFTSSVA